MDGHDFSRAHQSFAPVTTERASAREESPFRFSYVFWTCPNNSSTLPQRRNAICDLHREDTNNPIIWHD